MERQVNNGELVGGVSLLEGAYRSDRTDKIGVGSTVSFWYLQADTSRTERNRPRRRSHDAAGVWCTMRRGA